MDVDLETSPERTQHMPVDIDESRDFDFGPFDVVGAVLTLPLIFWVLMWAVTGSERIVATRPARYRLYAVLLVLEVAIAAAIAWWVTR